MSAPLAHQVALVDGQLNFVLISLYRPDLQPSLHFEKKLCPLRLLTAVRHKNQFAFTNRPYAGRVSKLKELGSTDPKGGNRTEKQALMSGRVRFYA